MKNVIKLLQFGSCISLIMLLIATVLPQNGNAQSAQISDSSEAWIVTGFELGKSDLTPEIRQSLKTLVDGPEGLRAQCEAGYVIEVWGYSDHHQFRGVSKERSDRLNDILAWDRLRVSLRYVVDQLGMPESCFNNNDPIYADSNKRGVMFSVIERPGGSFLHGKLAEEIANNVVAQIDERIQSLRDKNAEQDSILGDHEQRITENAEHNERQDSQISDHDERISALENRSWNVSGHIGVNGESFADQIAPTISAGIKVGQLEFAGWYGFMPNTGTADLDIGVVDLRRETYGGMATWYAINTGSLSLGPSIGWEHGEDAISGRGSYTRVIESVLAGASIDVELIGPLHLRGNIAYAPVIKSYTYDNQVLQDVDQPFRASLGISINF